jgi:hypothetical protein
VQGAAENKAETTRGGTGMNKDNPGEILFILAQRQDRIKEHLNKKIERLDRRVTLLEERGRE